MPEAGAEATKAAETQFDPEALSDQGMVFGISTAVRTVLWHNPHNPPLPDFSFFSSLRSFAQAYPDWQEYFDQHIPKIGRGATAEISQLLRYLDWVDQNYFEGVPRGIFAVSPRGKRLPLSLAAPTRERQNLGLLPIFSHPLNTAIITALKREEPVVATEQNYLPWQKEMSFLKKYYGLEIDVVAEREIREANLDRFLTKGEEVFNQLPAASLARIKVADFLKRTDFFDFFDPRETNKKPSLVTLRRFFCLALGIINEPEANISQKKREIVLQYYFHPGTTGKSLGACHGLSREIVNQTNYRTLHSVNTILSGTRTKVSLLLPDDWSKREEFFSPEERTVVQTATQGEVSFWEALNNLDEENANLVITTRDPGENQLELNLPQAQEVQEKPTIPLEKRSHEWFRNHGFLTLRHFLRETGIKPKRGDYKKLVPWLREQGIRVYKIPAFQENCFYYYVDIEDGEKALAALENWRG